MWGGEKLALKIPSPYPVVFYPIPQEGARML